MVKINNIILWFAFVQPWRILQLMPTLDRKRYPIVRQTHVKQDLINTQPWFIFHDTKLWLTCGGMEHHLRTSPNRTRQVSVTKRLHRAAWDNTRVFEVIQVAVSRCPLPQHAQFLSHADESCLHITKMWHRGPTDTLCVCWNDSTTTQQRPEYSNVLRWNLPPISVRALSSLWVTNPLHLTYKHMSFLRHTRATLVSPKVASVKPHTGACSQYIPIHTHTHQTNQNIQGTTQQRSFGMVLCQRFSNHATNWTVNIDERVVNCEVLVCFVLWATTALAKTLDTYSMDTYGAYGSTHNVFSLWSFCRHHTCPFHSCDSKSQLAIQLAIH